jgi:hypothetical protein
MFCTTKAFKLQIQTKSCKEKQKYSDLKAFKLKTKGFRGGRSK